MIDQLVEAIASEERSKTKIQSSITQPNPKAKVFVDIMTHGTGLKLPQQAGKAAQIPPPSKVTPKQTLQGKKK